MRILKLKKASWTAIACGLVTSAACSMPVFAKYPERPVKLVVPFAPGGSSDTASRILAEQLGKKWEQSVVIENKPGAAGSIGAMNVAKASADGYTLLVTPVSIGTIKLFLKNPGFDRDKDLTPITQFAKGDYVLVANKDLPVSSLPELINYAKTNPNSIFHAAFGGASRLTFEGLVMANKMNTENVNYRGEALALNALIAGEVQVMLSTLVGARPFIEAGRIKPLGLLARERSPILPDVPTAQENNIPGFDADFWFGLMAPAGIPEDIRKKIAQDVGEVLALPEIQQRFQELGLIAKSSTPEEFAKLIQHESERWVEIAKHAGIEPQ
ncbi:MAG: tripartite tricarboxylate transporter substrate binding protein [Advenella sp.]|nr:tripartite tricarboxylate transporter substrate binding protein [Advenella sp.]